MQIFDIQASAAAPMPGQRLVMNIMMPQQMAEGNIYNPNDACPICLERLGIIQPVIAIHCTSGAHGVDDIYHSYHAPCLRQWWESIELNARTCCLCNRPVPIDLAPRKSIMEIIRSDPYFLLMILYFALVVCLRNATISVIEGNYKSDDCLMDAGIRDLLVQKRHSEYEFLFCWEIQATILPLVFMFVFRYFEHRGPSFFEDLKRYFRQQEPEIKRLFEIGGTIELI